MSCLIISGLVLLALSFIASAVSLVAPYWLHTIGGHNTGLWADCSSNKHCTWFFEDDFKWEKAQEVWFQASQGLFAGGVVFLLFAFLVACINLCSGCCKCAHAMFNLVKGLLIFAFLCLAAGLVLYGIKVNKEFEATYERSIHTNYYDWGYWVGCGGALLDLLAILMYTCAGCRKTEHEGYTRGEVV